MFVWRQGSGEVGILFKKEHGLLDICVTLGKCDATGVWVSASTDVVRVAARSVSCKDSRREGVG